MKINRLFSRAVQNNGASSSGDRPMSSRNCYLIGIHGPYTGRRYRINPQGTRIGRDTTLNDVVLDKDPYTSRRHATLSMQDGSYLIVDRRSRSRTFVNKNEVPEDSYLIVQPGDEIEIGKNIFRFIEGERWDFSPPKKAGIFWVRNQSRIGMAVLATIVVLSIFGMLHAIQSLWTLNRKPADGALLEQAFTLLNEYPLATAMATPSFQSPAIGHLNSDQVPDIVLIRNDSVLTLNGKKGGRLWQRYLGHNEQVPPKLADMNGDGTTDVVALGNNQLVIYDGRTGIEIKERMDPLPGTFQTSLALGFMDADETPDVALATAEGVLYIGHLSRIGRDRWDRVALGNAPLAPPVITTLGGKETWIVLGDEAGRLWKVNANSPQSISSYDTKPILETMLGRPAGWVRDNNIRVPVAIGDINHDQIPDYTVSSRQGFVVVLDGADPNRGLMQAWLRTSWVNLPARYPAPFLFDFNGDGMTDIAVADHSDSIVVLDGGSEGKSARCLWSTHTGEQRSLQHLSAADLNKDGIPDLLISADEGFFFVVDGAMNCTKRFLAKVLLESTVHHAALVTDVGGNGYMDLVMQMAGKIKIINTRGRFFTGYTWWGNQFGGNDNTGPAPHGFSDQGFVSRLVLFAALLLAAVSAAFILYQRRKKLLPIQKAD